MKAKTKETEPKMEVLKAEPQMLIVTDKKGKSSNKIIDEIKKGIALVERHEKLKSTLDTLNDFELGSDRSNDSLSLRDGNGRRFETSNTIVVTEVLQLVKKKCIEAIQKSEIEVLQFSI